ncbi:MAG: NACHT domain-containing protein [Cyanobacteriota bacterium]|nr:NACHT domain-containing protein [Cyanobacteriota bacterium]
MDIQEALKWTDDRVFAKTGKHLDSLHKAILEGAWERQTYEEIGDENHSSKHHVRKEAWKLWQLLSDVFEEDVKKSNVRFIVEKGAFSYFNEGVQINNRINVCHENCPYPKTAKNRSPSTTNREQPRDLTDAPAKTDSLYNRTQELTTLKNWILQENSRLVTIAGLPGIGKTALARELLEQIQDKFDRLLWRSHRQFTSLKSLKTNLIEFLSPHRPTASIIHKLRSQRTLIILDNLQETFTSGQLAGTYRPDYQNYAQFLQEIAESPHNSCFVLLSREKPIEIENPHCRALQLGGLGESAREILAERGLTDENRWNELIDLYGGNPSWLKTTAATIEELFNGSVGQLLSCPTVFLGDLEPVLQASYDRLSESEKIAIAWLATQSAPVEIARKPADFPFSQSAFWKAVQSLTRRSLVEKVTSQGVSRFAVGAAMGEFVKEQNP